MNLVLFLPCSRLGLVACCDLLHLCCHHVYCRHFSFVFHWKLIRIVIVLPTCIAIRYLRSTSFSFFIRRLPNILGVYIVPILVLDLSSSFKSWIFIPSIIISTIIIISLVIISSSIIVVLVALIWSLITSWRINPIIPTILVTSVIIISIICDNHPVDFCLTNSIHHTLMYPPPGIETEFDLPRYHLQALFFLPKPLLFKAYYTHTGELYVLLNDKWDNGFEGYIRPWNALELSMWYIAYLVGTLIPLSSVEILVKTSWTCYA